MSGAWTVGDPTRAGAELAARLAAVEAAEVELRRSVAVMRACGWTWQEVADALGRTKQSCNAKYAGDAPADEDEVEAAASRLWLVWREPSYELRPRGGGATVSTHKSAATAWRALQRHPFRAQLAVWTVPPLGPPELAPMGGQGTLT